jgi:REP element-mobilizing transposase RayT
MRSTPNTSCINWPITLSGAPNTVKRFWWGKLAAFIEQEIRRICEANTWTIGALNVQEDHVHLFLSAPPSVAPSQVAHTLKGTTARRVFQHFPEWWSYRNQQAQQE